MPSRVCSAVVILLLLGGVCAAQAAAPRLSLDPSPVGQGQSLLVTLDPGAEMPSAGSCRWDGKEYALYPSGGRLQAFLPVTTEMAPGAHKVVVRLTVGGRTVQVERAVTVRRTDFGVQRLRMKAQTQALYTYPGADEERRLIGEAKARRTPLRLFTTPFLQPCPGRISTRFGLLRYINGKPEYRHRGVDIAAPRGTPVRAAEAGVVTLAREEFQLHGKTVVLDHGQGVASLYIHLDSIAVQEGDRVRRGQVIGRVGSTGAATGPHLHWGLYVQGEAVDPLFWTRWEGNAE